MTHLRANGKLRQAPADTFRGLSRGLLTPEKGIRVRNIAIYNSENKRLKIKQHHHIEHITTPVNKLLYSYSNGTVTSISLFINLDLEIMQNH